VTALVDADREEVAASYQYTPFGQLLHAEGDPTALANNPFGFSTKYHDAELPGAGDDLVYYGYRYYHPALQVWLNRDPIAEDGGLNLYAFVRNQPISRIDPVGLAVITGLSLSDGSGDSPEPSVGDGSSTTLTSDIHASASLHTLDGTSNADAGLDLNLAPDLASLAIGLSPISSNDSDESVPGVLLDAADVIASETTFTEDSFVLPQPRLQMVTLHSIGVMTDRERFPYELHNAAVFYSRDPSESNRQRLTSKVMSSCCCGPGLCSVPFLAKQRMIENPELAMHPQYRSHQVVAVRDIYVYEPPSLDYILSAFPAGRAAGPVPVAGATTRAVTRSATRRSVAGAPRGGATAVRVGRAGEDAVRGVFNIGPKELIRINGRGRIPDGLTTNVLSEVKNVRSLSFTRQLRDFSDFAQQTGRRFDLFLRPNTRVSRPLQDAIDSGLIRRVDIPQ